MLAVIKSRRPAYEVLVERKAAEVAEHLASALGAFAAAGAARVLGVKARRDAQKGELHSPSIVTVKTMAETPDKGVKLHSQYISEDSPL